MYSIPRSLVGGTPDRLHKDSESIVGCCRKTSFLTIVRGAEAILSLEYLESYLAQKERIAVSEAMKTVTKAST